MSTPYRLEVGEDGSVTLPQSLVSSLDVRPGSELVVTISDQHLQVAPATTVPGGFIAWREISHQLLSEAPDAA